ncbi:MAG: hypothetical protein EOP42_05370 [Sphingobacteriaceae bacterium]|nr:MAG: hypothetical protein EOP42_05370 [Sphingobacteriaceae bacterium]
MRKAFKDPASKIIVDNLKYIPGNSANNKKITEILLKEQKQFCAYTDEYLSRTASPDIDHFDPTLKNTPADNYYNWFLVKHQWNIEKSDKWKKFQSILHPTADDFEERIIYKEGDYFTKSKLDLEAQNLIDLLKLDDVELADERKKYIRRKQQDMEAYDQDELTFFNILINCDSCSVSYPRAIKEEFGIDIWAMID